MKRILIFVAAGIAAMSMMAESYLYLSKNDVNLREAPSTTAAVVEKGKKGAVFVLEESQSGWYKGKSAQYGDVPVWISATVAKKDFADQEMPGWKIVGIPEGPIPYTNVEKSTGGEVHTTWTFFCKDSDFWQDEKPGSVFDGVKSIAVINKNGSVRNYETLYKGEAYPYYLVLTFESTDGGETYSKLETPIYVYPSLQAESGIFIDGEFYFDDMGAMDDDW